MQMVRCPKCGADNSARREGCFNCGALLTTEGAPIPPTIVTVAESQRIPASSVLIGVIAGILALPFAFCFLASQFEHRRAYAKGLLLGFGVQAAIGIALMVLFGDSSGY